MLVIFLIACTRNDETRRYRTVIVNDSLKSVLRSYVNETNLNRNSNYVVVTYSDKGSREEYAISAGNSTAYRHFPPDYYAQLDDVIVLLYFTRDQIIDKHDVGRDLDGFFKDRKVMLHDTVRAYDPPTWILAKCLDTYELIRVIDPYRVTDLPCNCILKRTEKPDSLVIQRTSDR